MNLEQFLEEGKRLEITMGLTGTTVEEYREEIWPHILVRKCVEGPDEKVNSSYMRTRGNFNFSGQLSEGDRKCNKCGSENLFIGRYDCETELVRYNEIWGDNASDNYVVDTYVFSVCLDCSHLEEKKRD